MRVTHSYVAALILVCMALACSEAPPGPPYAAEVLALTGFDAETEVGRYEIGERELTTLTDFDLLDGQYLRLYRGGELFIEIINGSVVTEGRFEGRNDPSLRYHLDGDVAVPRDYPSLMMLSAYHQFEIVFAALERVTGQSIETLATDWPHFEVFFEPVIRVDDGTNATLAIKFNAFYLPGEKQFGLAQRSDVEVVPLAGNLMVIAHEFGHLLFESTFFRDRSGVCDPEAAASNRDDLAFPGRFEHEFVISGINEGFADFIAFAITGGTNPLADVPFIGIGRSMRRSTFDFEDYTLGSPECSDTFYCVGTLFARALYESMPALGLDPDDADDRGELSSHVVAAMRGVQATMEEDLLGLLPEPNGVVASCASLDRLNDVDDGALLSAFLHAFLVNMPEETRPALCERFHASFDTLAFHPEARTLCP